ncbi:hypothetical protein Tco_0060106 [Tanacetum coccineum]
MASINTRLNIEKLDGNIVQKHGCSKQVGFKQLGPCVETGVHGVHDEKCVWFEVELQGAQGDREAEVFQVSNDDTAVAQRWLVEKQPEEKTNTECLVKEQEKEHQTGWKIKMGNVLDSCNQRSTQQCMKSGVTKHLGVAGIQQQNGLVDETNVILFAKLASIKQGMLEPVKVKCIFLGYYKSIVRNKLWRLDDVTSKVVLYRNMGFNESGEYKKTFISSSIGAGLQEVQTQDLMDYQLARDREQHFACELFGYREDNNEVAFAVAVVEKIYAHKSLTFNNTIACKVISKWKAGLKDDMDVRSDVYVLINGCRKCSDDNDGYYWEYTPGLEKEDGKGTLTESRHEAKGIAGIATGALVKGGSLFEVPAQVEVATYRERKPFAPSHPYNANERSSLGFYVSILKLGKTNNVMFDQVLPSLILDDSCILDRDFSLSLMGTVKDIIAMPNLYVALEKKGFQNLSLTYLESLWVLIETISISAKEKLLNHTCVGPWFSSLKPACNSFVSDERVVWISLEGLPLKV